MAKVNLGVSLVVVGLGEDPGEVADLRGGAWGYSRPSFPAQMRRDLAYLSRGMVTLTRAVTQHHRLLMDSSGSGNLVSGPSGNGPRRGPPPAPSLLLQLQQSSQQQQQQQVDYNPQFARIVKLAYRLIRMRTASYILTQRAPLQFLYGARSLLSTMQIQLDSPVVRADLLELIEGSGSQVSDMLHNHWIRQDSVLESKLSTLHNLGDPRLSQIIFRQIMSSFGSKLSAQMIQAEIVRALAFTGTAPPPVLGLDTQGSVVNPLMAPVTSPEFSGDVTLKRQLSSSSSKPEAKIVCPGASSGSEDDSVILEPGELDEDALLGPGGKEDMQVEEVGMSGGESGYSKHRNEIQGSGSLLINVITIHKNVQKCDWILRLRSATTVLVVGDSNMARFGSFPLDWQLECFPGARLEHLPALLNSLKREPDAKLTFLIVAVGINNRDDKFQTVVDTWLGLVSQFDNTLPGVVLLWIGLGCTNRSRLYIQHFVNQFNVVLQDGLPKDRYIVPIPWKETRMVSPEEDNIHFDTHTAVRLGRLMMMHIADCRRIKKN